MDNASLQMLQGMPGGRTAAQRLIANGMNVNALRTNTTLRADEWKAIDAVILPIARTRLVAADDLVSRGLVKQVNGMAATITQYEKISGMSAAEMSMTARAASLKDRQTFTPATLPLPFSHKDFEIDSRTLTMSRNLGQPLDTSQAEEAMRKVADIIETTIMNGASSFAYAGATIYGYTDFTSRNTVTFNGGPWDDSADGDDILIDVRAMLQANRTALHYGPFGIYVPSLYETILDQDYSTSSWNTNRTIRERILQMDSVAFIKVSDALTADNVVCVNLSTDTVRLVVGLQPTPLEWDMEGGMVTNYKVMAIMVPELRADANGNSGIAHLSA